MPDQVVGPVPDALAPDRAIETFFGHLDKYSDRPALHWRGRIHTYSDLLLGISAWEARFEDLGIGEGTVVAYVADYWPEAVALMLALVRRRAIGVPFSESAEREAPKLTTIAGARVLLRLRADSEFDVKQLSPAETHPLIEQFRLRRRPGCIVFSSGSTGEPKGILHDFGKLLTKFEKPRAASNCSQLLQLFFLC